MKLFTVLYALVIVTLCSSPTADARPFVVPIRRSSALSVRGGAIEPLEVAKWNARVGLLQGIFFTAAPSKSIEAYGAKSTPLRDWIGDCLGQEMLSMFVFLHCLLDRNLDVNHAMAYSQIVLIVSNMRHILGDNALNVGFKKENFAFESFLHLATCYTVFSGHEWADTLVKFESTLWFAVGFVFVLAPQMAAKLWGQEKDIDDVAASQVKSIGYNLISQFGCACLMLFKGKSAVEAAGYAALVWVANCVDALFISKDCEKTGTPKGAMYAWLALSSTVAYLILNPALAEKVTTN